MGIKLLKSDTFEAPVIIIAPDGTKTPLKAKYLYMTQKKADAYVEANGEEALLDHVLKGWSDFIDVEDKAVKYTVANHKDVVETAFVRVRFLLGFAQGIVGLHLGNFAPSPMPGRRHPKKQRGGKAIKG